jgi:hypothetical protein
MIGKKKGVVFMMSSILLIGSAIASYANFSETPKTKNPFEDLIPAEKLGAGPHTLVISDGDAMTKIEYKTGARCQKARDSVRQQIVTPDTPGRIYGPSTVKAFCVPR